MARPSKYTPETAEKIVAALRAGNTLKDSALYVGIDEKTLANWRRRYSDFSDRLARAEAEATVKHVAAIARAAQDGDWRAAAWWLERRHSAEWRERKEQQITGKDGESLSGLTDAELDAAIAAALAGRPGAPAPPDRGTAAAPLPD